jgi:hypothetical protein
MTRRGSMMSMVPSRTPDTTTHAPPPGEAASAAAAAGRTVTVLRGFETALSPVIGPRGVAALCHRALHLSARRHPLLGELSFDPAAVVDFERLAQVLSRHTADDAHAAGDALIQDLRDLLTSLLGAALTEQLVGGVGPAHADAPPAQDTTP